MRPTRRSALAALSSPLAASPARAPYRAGVARRDITPRGPVLLEGYPAGSRGVAEGQGVLNSLFAKALAIEDSGGRRMVIVTADLCSIPADLTAAVARELWRRRRLPASRLWINVSHTHSGPALATEGPFDPRVLHVLTPEQYGRIVDYTRWLKQTLTAVADEALNGLAPAHLAFGHARAGFAINRRFRHLRLSQNPGARPDPVLDPTDPDVPVLRVQSGDGALKAVLFGYACHPVAVWRIPGQKLPPWLRLYSADYPGFAQAWIEDRYPGCAALFMQLCGGDQNPRRGAPAVAAGQGEELARGVSGVVATPMASVEGDIRSACLAAPLAFLPHTRAQFERQAEDPSPDLAAVARRMLKLYDAGRPMRELPYPVQAFTLGKDLTILALGGEPLVDYQLALKRQYGDRLLVAGYSNDVTAYVPTLRTWKEGGYEPVESCPLWGLPGPFADDVEQRVLAAVRKVLKRVGHA